MKFIGLVIGLLLIVVSVSGGLFGPDPTPSSVDTWTPVDKCWVYKQIECTASLCHDGTDGIVFYVTYANQNGHHELRRVDIDTWYNTRLYNGIMIMYRQGS